MDNRNGWHKRLRTGQNYSERVITNPLFLRSSAIFASFLPDPASSENKGESFIYALNYRTGTADEAGFLGMTTDGVLPGDVSAGVNELTEPALNYVHGNDPKPDQVAPSQASDAADSKVRVMAGTSEGGQEQLDFNMPPSALRRLSWELLETPF